MQILVSLTWKKHFRYVNIYKWKWWQAFTEIDNVGCNKSLTTTHAGVWELQPKLDEPTNDNLWLFSNEKLRTN